MTRPLWAVAPRPNPHTSLTEALTRDLGGSAEPSVATDLTFTEGTAVSNFEGAFSIAGETAVTFVSQQLYGPPPGILPCTWFHRDDAQRVILVELDYVDQSGTGPGGAPVTRTRYLANWPYFDDENSRAYADCIRQDGVPRYNRALDRATLRGRFTSSIGSLELDNDDGEFDDLLALACDGSEVRFYMGDATWPRSQFIFMFSALAAKISAPAWNRISVALKDTGLLLTKKVGGTTSIGGTGSNANKYAPWNFGFVRQVEFILKDAATLTYVHTESTAYTRSYTLAGNVVDVRDKGVSVGFTDNQDGSVSLHVPPQGTVTGDILVDAGYAGNLGATPPVAGTGYPLASTLGAYRVSDAFYVLAGIEAGLIAAGKYAGASANYSINWLPDFHIGLSITQSRDIVEVLDDVCDTGNCYWAVRRDGYWTFGQITPEAIDFIVTKQFTSVATIEDDNVFDLKITHADPGSYRVQGYANANWSEQSDFAAVDPSGPLTPALFDLYNRDGYYNPPWQGLDPDATTYLGAQYAPGGYLTWDGGAPQRYHRTMTSALRQRTLISCRDDVDATVELAAWNSTRRDMFLPWLEFVEIVVDLCFWQVEIGNIVTLNLTRFSLANVRYQCVGVDINLSAGRVTLALVRRRPAVTTTYDA